MVYEVELKRRGSGFSVKLFAGEDLGDRALVHIGSDEKCYLAKANGVNTMPALGVVRGAVSARQQAHLLLNGFIGSASWNWTPGGILYVSTTAGEMTQTQPHGTDDQVQTVGIAITQTLILFNPNYVLVERE